MRGLPTTHGCCSLLLPQPYLRGFRPSFARMAFASDTSRVSFAPPPPPTSGLSSRPRRRCMDESNVDSSLLKLDLDAIHSHQDGSQHLCCPCTSAGVAGPKLTAGSSTGSRHTSGRWRSRLRLLPRLSCSRLSRSPRSRRSRPRSRSLRGSGTHLKSQSCRQKRLPAGARRHTPCRRGGTAGRLPIISAALPAQTSRAGPVAMGVGRDHAGPDHDPAHAARGPRLCRLCLCHGRCQARRPHPHPYLAPCAPQRAVDVGQVGAWHAFPKVHVRVQQDIVQGRGCADAQAPNLDRTAALETCRGRAGGLVRSPELRMCNLKSCQNPSARARRSDTDRGRRESGGCGASARGRAPPAALAPCWGCGFGCGCGGPLPCPPPRAPPSALRPPVAAAGIGPHLVPIAHARCGTSGSLRRGSRACPPLPATIPI